MIKVIEVNKFKSGYVVVLEIEGVEGTLDIMLSDKEVFDILRTGKTVEEYIESLPVVM